MTDKELAINMLEVRKQCPFVSEVNQTDGIDWVNVELIVGIAQYLPHNRRVMQIERSQFTVDTVWEVYEQNVVVWLQEAYDKAVDLARRPKG